MAIGGALVGGMGSSILWVSQGSYFATSSKMYATFMDEPVEDITGRFGGNFAFIFLLFEVILRLMSTLFIETAGLSWKIIFGLYSLLSILPVGFMMGIMDLEEQRGCHHHDDHETHHHLCNNLLCSSTEEDGDGGGDGVKYYFILFSHVFCIGGKLKLSASLPFPCHWLDPKADYAGNLYVIPAQRRVSV